MKTIGIIGGLGWVSTARYYETINRLVAEKLGSRHCAKLIIAQTDSDTTLGLAGTEQWDKLAETLLQIARQLERAGADFILVACNTVHKVVPKVQAQLKLPILHIVDATAEKVRELGVPRVGLLGSELTMTDEYFASRLMKQGIEVLIPDEQDRKMIQHYLLAELVAGVFLEETREKFKAVIGQLVEQGAEAVILGCTEFGRLVQVEDCPVPLVDTADVHSEIAVKMALS